MRKHVCRTRRLSRATAPIVLTTVLMLALSGPAFAGALVSLGGENFDAFASPTGTYSSSGTCNPTGTSTYNFSSAGTATGPYPGAYSETGTYTFGPYTSIPGGATGGIVTSFDATFTITSGKVTITGSKHLQSNSDPANNFGQCDPATQAATFVYASYLTYSAAISDSHRTVTDSGRSGTFAYPGSSDFVENFYCGNLTGGHCAQPH
jgi:hypothetical protein